MSNMSTVHPSLIPVQLLAPPEGHHGEGIIYVKGKDPKVNNDPLNDEEDELLLRIPSRFASVEGHPSHLKLFLHQLHLPKHSPCQVQFTFRGSKLTIPCAPYAQEVILPLTFHRLLFDVVKIDILERSILRLYRVASARIKISEFPHDTNDALVSIDLYDSSKQTQKVGHIQLQTHFDEDTWNGFEESAKKVADSLSDSDELESPESPQNPMFNDQAFSGMMSALESSDMFESQSSTSSSQDTTSHSLKQSQNGLETTSVTSCVSSSDSTCVTSASSASISSSSSRFSVFTPKTIDGFKEISETLSAFFGTGWKISKADSARGLLLLSQYYHEYPTPRTFKLVMSEQKVRIASYFMDFALVTYGALALNAFGYGRGILRDVLRQNPDKKAAIRHLNIPSKDILVWDFDSPELFKPNYFICYDARCNALVIAFRGTFGFHETLADAHGEYAPFKGGLSHKGVVESVKWFEEQHTDTLISYLSKYKATALYLTGHSLGGAIAAVLLMSMRENLQSFFPSLRIRAFTFGAPPSASLDLIEKYGKDIYSFVNEVDVVPRISYGSLMDFKFLLVKAVELSKRKDVDKQAKFTTLTTYASELKHNNTHPRIYIPGKVYYMYRTNRHYAKLDKRKPPKQLSTLFNPSKSHFVVEESSPFHFADFHVRPGILFQHVVNVYDGHLRKVQDWIVESQGKFDRKQ